MSRMHVSCNGTNIDSKTNVKYLGVVLENDLSGSVMCRKVLKKVNNGLKFLYRKRDFLEFKERKMVCGALFQSHFDYAVNVWYRVLTKYLKERL